MNVHPEIHTALRHYNAREPGKAAQICQRILTTHPNEADAWHILGLIARDAGHLDQAIDLVTRAARINPRAGLFHHSLGRILNDAGRSAEAIAHLRQALALLPTHAGIHHQLGLCLQAQGNFPAAIQSYQAALKFQPRDARAMLNLGTAQKALGMLSEAEHSLRSALGMKPDYGLAYYNLGAVLQAMGRLNDASAAYLRAIDLLPQHADSYSNLATIQQLQGNLHAAIDNYRHAVRSRPGFVDAHSNMLLAMNYADNHPPEVIYREHKAWAAAHAETLQHALPPFHNDKDPERRLRIGYVSPDFRKHAVAHFIEPVLQQHAQSRFEIFCYANVRSPDDVTARIRGLPVTWRDIYGRTDEDVVNQIRSDRIDILIDLAGHTANHRLLVFARKPAPVQATWLGYLSTTGLATIDYRIADGHTSPPDLCDRFYTETIVRLPNTFVCYQPPAEAPPVAPLPALRNGYVTFGSFNNFAKITPEVLKLWAEVLNTVQDSHLLLKTDGLNDMDTRRGIQAYFASAGIDSQRVELLGRDNSFTEHLQRYGQFDIGLDPFPCNGGTTSCDAIWMGIPIVSLEGNSFISRMGVSMLRNIGLEHLIASDKSAYVDIARQLAGNIDALAELRGNLRQRMADSPLTDAARFTRDLEQAYLAMWSTWCSTSGPAA